MKWIIIITIYLLQQFQSVQAAGSGILRFVNFTTPWGNGRYSNCCPDGQTSVCRGQCDVHINICVGDVSPDRNCIYGEGAFNFHVDETTREISFGDMTGSLPNPLVYRFDVWKLGVTVDVDVVIGESLLTDSIRFHLHTKPEPNGQVVKVGPQQYTGYRTGVTLEHSVSCDPFYFRECATLCLPDPATYTCDRNGNRRCLPDIDCGFEFTDSSTAYEEQVDGGGIYATVSNEFPSSSVDTVQEYSTHPSGSTAVNTEYIESAIESSTTGRGDFNENIISTENLKYSSQQDDVTSIGPFSDLLTSLHFNENTVSKENSTLTSKQEDVTSTRSYTDPTTLLMSETSEDETASVHKVTEAWSTSTDGETVITKVSNSPGDISEGTISYNSIDTATTDNSASTATPSTPTPSIPTPSTTDVTTLTVPHECTGHTTVSGDTKGMLVSQHATDSNVDFASYRSSNPELSTIPEHDFLTSFTTKELPVYSNQNPVESSTSDVDSSSLIATNQYLEVTKSRGVTHLQEIHSNTYDYGEFVATTFSMNKLSSNPPTIKTPLPTDVISLDTNSVTLFVSDPVSQQTTSEDSSSEGTVMLSSNAAGDISTTTFVRNTKTEPLTVTSGESTDSLYTSSDLVTSGISAASVTSAETDMTSNVKTSTSSVISYGEGTSTPFSVVSRSDLNSTPLIMVGLSSSKSSSRPLSEVSSSDLNSTPLPVVSSSEFTSTPLPVVSSSEFTSTPLPVISSSEFSFTTRSAVPNEESSPYDTKVTNFNQYLSSTKNTLSNSEHTKQPNVSSQGVISTSTEVTSNYEVTTGKQSTSFSEERTQSNLITSEKVTFKENKIATTVSMKTRETPSGTNTFTNVNVESNLSTVNSSRPLISVHTGIIREITTRSITKESTSNKTMLLTQPPHASSPSGLPTAAVGTTDELQTPYPTETASVYLTGASGATADSPRKSSVSDYIATTKDTKYVPVSSANSDLSSTLTTSSKDIPTSLTNQELSTPNPSIQDGGKTSTAVPTVTRHTGPLTTLRSSSCVAAVVYPGGGKAVLTIQVAQGLQVVSMDVMEKKVVDFLSSAGFKVDTNDINAIKTSVGGLTIVNITIDDDDLAVSQTALGDFGNKLCTEESMFLIQPPSSGYTKEDTDGSNGVLVGMLVLAAYLLTLFIIAFILVRRKYRERNRISGRPMSEVSKMSQASELLTDRPETCMTGVLSEYGETNC
ncbi:mucin-17-like isoform X1 [Pecten maximus]|uniref:mucin-17-like isoform X1 n=1 Tax=Pecten maximus TaxID=6579 RepID=UPI001458D537|nr:mucin-17-like isoform X1 [Pecten maximus]